MENRNYIVSIDEAGEPYIAHFWQGAKTMASGRVSKGASGVAQGVGRGVRKVHKYIAKWGEGPKAEYFYTQEELEAAMHRGQQKHHKVSKSFGDKPQKTQVNTVKFGKTGPKSTASFSERVKDFSSRTSSTLKRHGSEMLSDIKGATGRAKDKISSTYEKARNAATDAVERAKDRVSLAKDDAKDRISLAKDDLKDRMTYLPDKAKDAVKAAGERVKDTVTDAVEKTKESAGKAKDAVKGATGSVAEKAKETVEKVKDKAKDWAGYDEKERMEAAQKEFQDKYEEGLRLTEEREPIRKAYYDYDTEMFQKYGVNYEDKMTPSEKAKYDKLGKELSDISEKWWDATIRQMHSAAYRSDPTLRDKLDDAIAEYQNTPLGMLDKLKRK